MPKKQYFREPSLAGILKDSEPVYVSMPYKFIEKVFGLKENQYLVINSMLIPPKYGSQKRFLKHGKFVQIKTPSSIDEAVENHMFPFRLRQESFDSIDSIYKPGYSFRPFADFQDDKRERRVSLVEICEALRILSYGAQTGSDIRIIKAYADSERAAKDGATIAVSVPSRTEKHPRYNFNMRSVVVDSNDPNSYAVANGFATDISLPAKRWSFGYNFYEDKEDSNVVNIFAPEITAYFKFMLQELYKEKPNKSSADMTPFGIPTNLTINYYKKLISQAVIYDPKSKNKGNLRRLNNAEQEVMLWALVKELKYEETFFRRLKRDGPIGEINWKLPKVIYK